MHIEILVGERSARAALELLVPRIIGSQHTFIVHAFQGKPDLLAKLPKRLRGYRGWMRDELRVMVLMDEDRQDCIDLKTRLEADAAQAGLHTRRTAAGSAVQVVNRIAVEELESWFFGDVEAIVAAFPRISPSLASRRPYRDPDAIRGGTWEALERVLQQAGYYGGGLTKIDAAGRVARHMDPDRNRSRSFRVFRDALRALVS